MAKTVSAAELHREWMLDPAYRQEYAALDLEFRVAAAVIDARSKAGLTQAQLAERMNTSRTVVVRLEGGRTLPSLATLRKVASATGHSINLEIA